MASIICVKCSSEVPDSSEQCPECGFPFDSLTPVQCPKCQNMVVFTSGLCPVCDFPYEKLDDGVTDAAVIDDSVAAATAEPGTADLGTEDLALETASDENDGIQDVAEPSSGAPLQAEQSTLIESDLAALCNNPIDNDYIIYAIKNYISEVKVDLVNKPIKAFIQILTELDNSNTELYKTVVKQGIDTLTGVQEASLTTASEIAKITELQSLETLSKSQELTLTIVSEINAATATLKEAHSAVAADLSENIKQISAQLAQPVQPAQSAQPAQPASVQPESTPASNDMSEYILYLYIGMLVFTIANLFITIYAVKLIK